MEKDEERLERGGRREVIFKGKDISVAFVKLEIKRFF